MLPIVDYSVSVPVPVDEAFRAFQNIERLLKRGVYSEAAWTEGAPWQLGSRLRYVVSKPVEAVVTAVVTAISPPRTIDIINHGIGVTAEQHVSFGPDLKGGTRIRMTMTMVGKSSELSETDLQKTATFITRDALDSVVAYLQKNQSRSSPKK